MPPRNSTRPMHKTKAQHTVYITTQSDRTWIDLFMHSLTHLSIDPSILSYLFPLLHAYFYFYLSIHMDCVSDWIPHLWDSSWGESSGGADKSEESSGDLHCDIFGCVEL
mmetsp:Transcript_13618/g.19630  ORF Transcript_13618/g.19630 Transcript_13618/m.19630 type:complete len:109 (-) Transcript_13618:73-399(-)